MRREKGRLTAGRGVEVRGAVGLAGPVAVGLAVAAVVAAAAAGAGARIGERQTADCKDR